MKKAILLFVMLTTLVQAQAKTPVPLPEKCQIDVEKIQNNLDLNMDLSRLNLYELRVLKAAVAARKGECIMESELRGLFDATSWYTNLATHQMFDDDAKPITYTAQEKDFIARIEQAEAALKAKNFSQQNGRTCPNLANLANPLQMVSMPSNLETALTKNGFAIVPGEANQLFHIYETNDYHEFPSFVTTDLYLQMFHMYFDYMLRNMEEKKMLGIATNYTKQLYQTMMKKASSSKGEMKKAAQRDAAYFAIAHALFTGKLSLTPPAAYAKMVKDEINKVNAAGNAYSDFLDYKNVKFGYDIYRPRGHYTRSKALERYFRGMMWLQNAPFGSDKPDQMRAALLMAHTIGSTPSLTETYSSINDPITFLMGMPDNLSMLQVYEIIKADGASINSLMTDNAAFERVTKKVEAKDEEQTRIRPKFERTSHCKINLMPQRYMPDGEVLQEMVDYDNETTLRDVPKGLDVMAAIGMTNAERILMEELKEPSRWNKYTENLNCMKGRMKQIDWNVSVANRWIKTLQTFNGTAVGMPYFMLTPQWQKKNLNTALASWAELKHDAILYAKQPSGAECGGGSLPDPYVKGYVEPNVAYWTKAIELLDATSEVMNRSKLMTDGMADVTKQMREAAQFLLNMSNKELQGVKLTEEEYNQIEIMGSNCEYITLQIVGAGPGTKWDEAVSGADKSIAVVADVYTANADNNPNKSVLYEAVGPAHEIYVVVEIEGCLYITRGAVFSYREFQEDIASPRMTDEDWQNQIKVKPNLGIPSWMEELIVPLDGKSLDNEHLFYSTGC